jgi:phage terminase large subunit-like protein
MPHFELSPKQQKALFSEADIVIFGGGNGGGKSFTLRALPLLPQYLNTPACRSVLFAETNVKLEQADGMVDECRKMYGALHPQGLGGYKQTPKKRWTWPSGATVDLSYVGEPGQWDGMQAAIIGIDQVEQISWAQFDSITGRNRTMTGVKARTFATANPPEEGKEHWLTQLLTAGGFIDGKGWAVPEMEGRVRFYALVNDEFVFADSVEELRAMNVLVKDREGVDIPPKSLTFVQALVDDHPDKAFRDSYKRELAAKGEIERARRLRGNWHATDEAGKYFRREWFDVVIYVPTYRAEQVRSWDNAWSKSDAADATVGLLMAQEPDNFLTMRDMLRFRGSPFHVSRAVRLIAELDGPDIIIRLPFDAGRAGFDQTELARWLRARGYRVILTRDVGDKLTRSKAYQERCEGREVRLADSHLSAGVAEELTRDFVVYDADGKPIRVDGLKRSNISTLDEWHTSFLADHVRFGRDTISVKSIKKDTVDAAVGGNEVLTTGLDVDPADVEIEDIQRATAQAMREVGSSQYGGIGLGGGRVGGPRILRR